ncbi:hypothetical protein [Vibrio rotiferianus]|uniref:hypothetical protein n=1 Tax=Vibrio rotiferianus TaxID=190895 RepID=UPI0011102C46|nr:hypothetical protein [Vibrio rotiferianus]TMX60644.1 hypothetical protein DA097_17200 [Vibrio rotiferianus]CAH1553612.1 conserved hypothetical protein [Vibrio rotiferianus]
MSTFYFNDIPSHVLNRLIAVREPVDNLWNVLIVVEAINCAPQYHQIADDPFDVAVFTQNCQRFLVQKEDGYFSMSNPFQVIIQDNTNTMHFNCDQLQEQVGGMLISILKNAITTFKNEGHSHENIIVSISENFGLDVQESIRYYDTFASLISEEHGYFRFDDDPNNINGNIHPRYHFDIFCTNSSALKVGTPCLVGTDYFLALADKTVEKKYLADSTQIL